MEPLNARVNEATDLTAYFLEQAQALIRWSIEHPAYSQLMFWRPVPNYEPSAAAL